MAVKCLTFKTNHTIIGECSDEGDFYLIKNTVQVVSVPPTKANEQGGIAFSPFLEYTDEFRTGIKFDKKDILTVTQPVLELENQYNHVFGSGIQIASSLN